jgi:hypothetical protein
MRTKHHADVPDLSPIFRKRRAVMRITDVELLIAPMASNWLTERVIANPMSIYPEYFERRSSWYRQMTAGVVRVTVEDGSYGLGFVGGSKASAAAQVLHEQVRHLVVGKDCFQTELVWEQLYRATIFYGQGGIAQALISGIDIALWDLKGKLLERSVYDLLGGKTADVLKPYLTSFDAEALEEFGIRDVKIADAVWARARRSWQAEERGGRQAKRGSSLAPDAFIALDCYMAWNVPYRRHGWLRKDQGCRQLPCHWRRALLHPRRVPSPDRGRRRGHRAAGHLPSRWSDSAQEDRRSCKGQQPRANLPWGRPADLPLPHSNGPELSPRCEYLDIYNGSPTGWVLPDDPRPKDGELQLTEQPSFGYELVQHSFQQGETVSPI